MDRALITRIPSNSTARAGFLILLALLMLAGAEKQVTGNTLDPDVFWHMRVGRQLLHDGVGPLVDDLSFNSIPQPWTPYSWLAEIALDRTWQVGGLRAAVVLGAALIATMVALLAFACYQARRGAARDGEDASGGLLPVLLATTVGMMLCLRYLTLRPVTMAFVIIAACVGLLLRDRRWGERTLAVWLVPPWVALGVNFHFFTALVPLYIACLLAGGVWEWMRTRDAITRPERALRCRRYALLMAATIVGCAATPMLPGLIRTIFYYTAHDPMVASGLIAELQPFYVGFAGAVSAAAVVAILACVLVWRRYVRAGEVLAMVASAGLILVFGRFMPLFALTAAPFLAATLPPISGRLLQSPLVAACVAAVVVLTGYRTVADLPRAGRPDSAWLNRLPATKGYPCEAADYVLANVPRRSGRIINEFGWGGYLAWRLGGRYQVLIDGRTQLYPASVWHATYLGSDEQLARFLADAGADAAILSRQAGRFERALRQLGWRLVYEDVRSRVFLPKLEG
jgi:hypothetical protein